MYLTKKIAIKVKIKDLCFFFLWCLFFCLFLKKICFFVYLWPVFVPALVAVKSL